MSGLPTREAVERLEQSVARLNKMATLITGEAVFIRKAKTQLLDALAEPEPEKKPRKMAANPHFHHSLIHGVEHDENERCAKFRVHPGGDSAACAPFEKLAPDWTQIAEFGDTVDRTKNGGQISNCTVLGVFGRRITLKGPGGSIYTANVAQCRVVKKAEIVPKDVVRLRDTEEIGVVSYALGNDEYSIMIFGIDSRIYSRADLILVERRDALNMLMGVKIPPQKVEDAT